MRLRNHLVQIFPQPPFSLRVRVLPSLSLEKFGLKNEKSFRGICHLMTGVIQQHSSSAVCTYDILRTIRIKRGVCPSNIHDLVRGYFYPLTCTTPLNSACADSSSALRTCTISDRRDTTRCGQQLRRQRGDYSLCKYQAYWIREAEHINLSQDQKKKRKREKKKERRMSQEEEKKICKTTLQ